MQLELRRQPWHGGARGRSAGGASARHQRAYIAPPWTGRGCRIELGPPAGGVLSSCTRARRAACWQSFGGQNKRAHRREPGAVWGRARCMPRGRGRRPRAVGRAGSMQLELRRQAWHSCARGRCEGLAFWHETPACGRLNLVRNLVAKSLAFWHKTPAYGTLPDFCPNI